MLLSLTRQSKNQRLRDALHVSDPGTRAHVAVSPVRSSCGGLCAGQRFRVHTQQMGEGVLWGRGPAFPGVAFRAGSGPSRPCHAWGGKRKGQVHTCAGQVEFRADCELPSCAFAHVGASAGHLQGPVGRLRLRADSREGLSLPGGSASREEDRLFSELAFGLQH